MEKNPKIDYLTVLEVRSPKWAGRAAFLLEALEESQFLCLFQLLEAVRVLWLIAPSSNGVTPTSALSAQLLLPPGFLRTSPNPTVSLLPPSYKVPYIGHT